MFLSSYWWVCSFVISAEQWESYFCCWDKWSLNDYETLLFASSIILSKHWDQQLNWRVESFFASSHWRSVSRSRLWCQLKRLDQDSIQLRLIYDRIADLIRWRESFLFKFSKLAFLDKKKIRVQIRKRRCTVYNIQKITSEILLIEIALKLSLSPRLLQIASKCVDAKRFDRWCFKSLEVTHELTQYRKI